MQNSLNSFTLYKVDEGIFNPNLFDKYKNSKTKGYLSLNKYILGNIDAQVPKMINSKWWPDNMEEYFGMDRYLTAIHPYDMTHFKYWQDWYSAWKAYPASHKEKKSPWQTMQTSDGEVLIMMIPDASICIMNAPTTVSSKQEWEVFDQVFSFYYK